MLRMLSDAFPVTDPNTCTWSSLLAHLTRASSCIPGMFGLSEQIKRFDVKFTKLLSNESDYTMSKAPEMPSATSMGFSCMESDHSTSGH